MERLEAAIARLGITGATIVSTDGMPPDAAIAKSLIWMINGEAAVLVLRQFDIVDLDLLERSLCCRGKLISRREAADLSGFEIGSIPPIGHALDMKVHICKRLVDAVNESTDIEAERALYCGGGEAGYELRVPIRQLLALPSVSHDHVFSCPDKEHLRHESRSLSANTTMHMQDDCSAVSNVVTSQRALQNLLVRDGASVVQVLRNSLRERSVDPAGVGPAGKNALHIAAWRGSEEVVDILLSSGCDINAISVGEGNYGKTALFYAITRCRDDMVRHLLRRGAVVSVVNNKGQSVVSLAATHLAHETQHLLIQHELKEFNNGVQWQDYFASHPDGRDYGDLDPRFVPNLLFLRNRHFVQLEPVILTPVPSLATSGPSGVRRYRIHYKSGAYRVNVEECIDLPISILPSTHDARIEKAETINRAKKLLRTATGDVDTIKKLKNKSMKGFTMTCDTSHKVFVQGTINYARFDKDGYLFIKLLPHSDLAKKNYNISCDAFGNGFKSNIEDKGINVTGESVAAYVDVKVKTGDANIYTAYGICNCFSVNGFCLVDNDSQSDDHSGYWRLYPNANIELGQCWICDPEALIGQAVRVEGTINSFGVINCRDYSLSEPHQWKVSLHAISVHFCNHFNERLAKQGDQDNHQVSIEIVTSAALAVDSFVLFSLPLSHLEVKGIHVTSDSIIFSDKAYDHLPLLDFEFISGVLTSRNVVLRNDAAHETDFDYKYVSTLSDIESFICDINEYFFNLPAFGDGGKTPNDIVAIDAEWEPEFKGTFNEVSIIQIAFRRRVYIIDMQTIYSYPQLSIGAVISKPVCLLNNVLLRLFIHEGVLKLGYAVEGDVKRLQMSFPNMSCFRNIRNLLDLQKIGSFLVSKLQPSISLGNSISLSDLCVFLLHKMLNKSEQVSHWAHRPLTDAQLEYAYIDAAVLIVLYDHLEYYLLHR